MKHQDKMVEQLPQCAREYIDLVIRKMGWQRKVRAEVRRELAGHFADVLAACTDENQRLPAAQKLIAEFGDAKLLAVLLRRGKKRCRPLWQKILIRTAQTIFVLYLLSILSNVYVMHSWKNNPRDYLAEFNQQGRKNLPDDQNAYTYYRQASELFTAMPEKLSAYIHREKGGYLTIFRSMSPTQQEQLRHWLEENAEAWNTAKEGSRLDYFWWELPPAALDPADPDFNRHMLDLSAFHRSLARLGCWNAIYKFVQGQNERGIDDLEAVLNMGVHLTKGRTLIEYLSGVAIIKLSASGILETLKDKVLNCQDLATIQNKWGGGIREHFVQLPLESEMLYSMAFLSRGPLFTYHPGKYFVPGISLMLGSRENFDDEARIWFDKLEALETENHVYQRDREPDHFRPVLPKKLLEMCYKASANIIKKQKEYIADFDAFLTIVALHRFRMDKGAFPERLSELVEEKYLNQLPADPYAADALRYEKRGDDFILYSVGENLQDNSGAQDSNNLWGKKEEGGGDRVFWPIP